MVELLSNLRKGNPDGAKAFAEQAVVLCKDIIAKCDDLAKRDVTEDDRAFLELAYPKQGRTDPTPADKCAVLIARELLAFYPETAKEAWKTYAKERYGLRVAPVGDPSA